MMDLIVVFAFEVFWRVMVYGAIFQAACVVLVLFIAFSLFGIGILALVYVWVKSWLCKIKAVFVVICGNKHRVKEA